MKSGNIQEGQIDKDSNCGTILQEQVGNHNVHRNNFDSQNVKNQKVNSHNADEKTSERNIAWHTECAYAYFWETMPAVGARTIEKLYGTFHSYEEMYVQLKKGCLKSCLYKELHLIGQLSDLKQLKKQLIEKHIQEWNVSSQYQQILTNHIFCVPKYLDGYPIKLKEIYDAPSALFVKGKLPDENMPLVAIIGSRNCSNYGTMMAKQLGKRLAENRIGVISGLARGIDGIAQLAALENGGCSFGVLGSGVDVCYPEENFGLYERLAKGECQGGVISEFVPHTPAERNHFPMRNRIISGLADAIVVIEAKEKSGTLITVERALEQGKNVYAIPGRLNDRLSYGCNRLIAQGAGIIWDMDEFVNEVYSRSLYQHSLTTTCAEKSGDSCIELCVHIEKEYSLNSVQKEIYHQLDLQFQSLDDILSKFGGMEVQNLTVELADMERKGIVDQINGFYRIKEK